MSKLSVRRLTIVVMICAVVVLGLYDIYAAAYGGGEGTISVVIWDYAQDYPMIPFVMGVLMGHFFWQNSK